MELVPGAKEVGGRSSKGRGAGIGVLEDCRCWHWAAKVEKQLSQQTSPRGATLCLLPGV